MAGLCSWEGCSAVPPLDDSACKISCKETAKVISLLVRRAFRRDPREVPFLHEEVKKAVALADLSSRIVRIRETTISVSCPSSFSISKCSTGLIARTMIDGQYQLLWTVQLPSERARLWRSYFAIHDWRLIQGRLREGIAVDSADILATENRLKTFGNLRQLKKLKRNSPDPDHRTWHGGVKLADMADAVGRELYDGLYAELSDWEHWGVSGIGEAIALDNCRATVSTNSDRVAGLSLLAAFQCLLKTLEVVDIHLSLKITDAIHALGKEFRTTLGSFYHD